MQVSGLYIYPVKGLRAVALADAEVTPRGLRFDRRWMLVDMAGKFITQREQPTLATLSADITVAGLRISGSGKSIDIPEPDAAAQRLPVKLWKQDIEGFAVSPAADAWFSDYLGTPCRLVFQGDLPRAASEKYAPGAEVSYADGFPILVTVTESLDDLNAKMPAALPMDRFRPNIVVTGTTAWAEDSWKKLRVGDITFDIVKPCTRCVVTTTDQLTGDKSGSEPLNTLKSFRLLRTPDLTGVVFGQNAVPRAAGHIKMGDTVEVAAIQAPPAFVKIA